MFNSGIDIVHLLLMNVLVGKVKLLMF